MQIANFLVLISVSTLVAYYYMWTLLAEQKRLKVFLKLELEASKKELRQLLSKKELKNFLND